MPLGRGCYQHPVSDSQARREAMSVQNVTVAFRPSGRAEGQEAGAVSWAGTWPVRPAAAPAAPTAPGQPYRML
jgi:hypothetical protein